MYAFCTFLLQLAPSALIVGFYHNVQQKQQRQLQNLQTLETDLKAWIETKAENSKKEKTTIDDIVLKYDKRTTLLNDKLTELERRLNYLQEVDRRLGVLGWLSVMIVFSLYSLITICKR